MKRSVYFLLLVLVSACGTEPKQPTVKAAPTAPDCLPRLKEFLRWYPAFTERRDTTDDFFNIPLAGDETPEMLADLPRGSISRSGYMELNRPKVDNYIAKLRRSGYFSASYLAEKRASILKRGAAVEAQKMRENGVPEGFDADEVFGMQDFWEPQAVDNLKPYAAPGLAPPAQAYRLRLEPEFTILLYTKPEGGRCVVDSIRSYASN